MVEIIQNYWSVLMVGIILIILLSCARFTTVQEGQAKAILKLGKFSRIIFSWEEHFMDTHCYIWKNEDVKEKKNEKIEPGGKKRMWGRIWGGLYFYGFWPIHKIHTYHHRWFDARFDAKGKMIMSLRDETLDFVLLRPVVYSLLVERAETKPPERFAVTIKVLVTMRIINPYLFLFVAPPTAIEDILGRLAALIRGWISDLTIDELLSLKGRANKIWYGWQLKKEGLDGKEWGFEEEEKVGGLKDEKLIKETLLKWGLEVAEQGIDFYEINVEEQYQEVMAKRREEELKAEARAQETMGSLIKMMSLVEGVDEADFRKKLQENPEKQKELQDKAYELLVRKLGWEKGGLYEILTKGTGSLDEGLLKSVALGAKLFSDKSKGQEKKEPLYPGEGGRIPTKEEVEADVREVFGLPPIDVNEEIDEKKRKK
ncbi:MAG: hypothetical protein ACPLW9_00470 [Minisyncoccales bacterium]